MNSSWLSRGALPNDSEYPYMFQLKGNYATIKVMIKADRIINIPFVSFIYYREISSSLIEVS